MDALATVESAALPAKKFIRHHDSGILTAVTMGATAAAVYFALKDGPKCEKILQKKREEGASNVEKAKAVLPVAGRTMMAVAVAWGSAFLNHKRSADKIIALTEAVSLGRTMMADRKKAEVETVGEEKAAEIDKRVVISKATEAPVILSEVETTGHGNFIFREPMTGKTFRASKDYIEMVVQKWSNEVTKYHVGIREGRYDEDFEVSMSDIFEDIGLSHCGFADLFVWPAIDFDSIEVNLNNTFEYEGPDGTMEPGYILDFYTKPVLTYSSYNKGARGY